MDPPGEIDVESVCTRCMGSALYERAREIADQADPDDEGNPRWSSCSFCEIAMEPLGETVAISWSKYMELVYDGLSVVLTTGSEQGNPPSDGGDGLTWLSVEEVVGYCDGAVGDGGFLLLREIKHSLGADVWTYHDFGWSRLHLKLGWERFKDHAQDRDRQDSPLVVSPQKFLRRLEQIVTFIVPGAITVLEEGTMLWRSRPHARREPDFQVTGAELGSAPDRFARDNRFSPGGVSMFYGSEDPETTYAEILGYTECQYATVGAFRAMKDLTILDLSQVNYYPNIFDPNERDDYYDADFLHGFVDEIARPLHDGEDYRATQLVVSEGIRSFCVDPVDGIRYQSVQSPGRFNYVLFRGNHDCSDAGKDDGAVLHLDPTSLQIGVKLATNADRLNGACE
ncbi:RES family NAD+ phosphorylase [Rhodococcoides fascians A21d2]|uniref:RES family NAD+ phosphorylase n=1 Tax=Nocardiaceae TaxID=85025 RepID=UPI0013EF4CE4|nr:MULTISPECIES: RES family NAD+ phosphorylase [Rhodococcus]QIH99767.1 RES family NAD+ phosphorylase [Rhodococcus fascians A21d2]